MKADELKGLRDRATEWHNAHPMEERRVLCIASMSQQITTLLSMKEKIRRMADAECRRIDEWVDNVARSLRKELNALQPDHGLAELNPAPECPNPECQEGRIYMDCGGDNHTVIDCPDCTPARAEQPVAKCVCPSPRTSICGQDSVTDENGRCVKRLPDGSYCGHSHACHALAKPTDSTGDKV